jgi:peptidoglycan/LPS O-acetylase OafA/YrhL
VSGGGISRHAPRANAEDRARTVPPSGYRPALDGVRAVAILAVLGYHIGSSVPGGFLGVDVFFVLSGYLITSLILRDRGSEGGIRLRQFWARRARRLLPAVLILVVVVAFLSAAGVRGVEASRGDQLSTVFYFANWHFAALAQHAHVAQFSVGNSALSHMWSLSIEEQFYLLWPLLLILTTQLFRLSDRALLACVAFAAAAGAALLNVVYEPSHAVRAYVGTDTRASELLVGAALAILIVSRPQVLASPRLRAVARFGWPLVALLVGLAFLAMKRHASIYYHGGAFAFCLVVASGLLIVEAMPDSALARLLSLRPVRWIGMVSYGVYLWHWPVVRWAGAHVAGTRARQFLELLLPFAIATVSFYAVERPVRSGRVPWLGLSPRRLALALAVAIPAVVAISVASTA